MAWSRAWQPRAGAIRTDEPLGLWQEGLEDLDTRRLAAPNRRRVGARLRCAVGLTPLDPAQGASSSIGYLGSEQPYGAAATIGALPP